MAAEPAGFEIVPKLADWACSPTGPRLTDLLGEFGMGKTVACQLLTQELLSRRRDGDPDAPHFISTSATSILLARPGA